MTMFQYQSTIYKTFGWHNHSINNLTIINNNLNIKSIKTHHDMACGTGDFVNAIAKIGINSSGSDISPSMINIAKKQFNNLDFNICDMTNIILKEAVDLITINYFSINMLKSIDDFNLVFNKACQNLNKGGHLVFDCASYYFINNTTINSFQHRNSTYLLEDIKSKNSKCTFKLTWFRKVGKNYKKSVERYDEITLPIIELSELLRSNGLEPTKIIPLDSSEAGKDIDKLSNGFMVISMKIW